MDAVHPRFREKATAAKAKLTSRYRRRGPASSPVPARVDTQPHPKIQTKLKLRAMRGNEDGRKHKRANTVAHIRGAGMVVKYELLKRKPLDENPAFGVLAGRSSKTGTRRTIPAEEFFRLAEPPLHDDWEYTACNPRPVCPRGRKVLIGASGKDPGWDATALSTDDPSASRRDRAASKDCSLRGAGAGRAKTPKLTLR